MANPEGYRRLQWQFQGQNIYIYFFYQFAQPAGPKIILCFPHMFVCIPNYRVQ